MQKKEEVKENKVEEKPLDVELERAKKIQEIFVKKAKAQRLTEEEQAIHDSVIEEAKQFALEQEKQELKEAYVKQQQEIKQEASEAPEDAFLPQDAPSISLNKGPSAVQEWVSNFLANRNISSGKKKGGTFILKGYRDTGIELVWSKKPVRFVKFTIQNEKGESLEYLTRVVKTKHRWKGTSIPVHVALEGVNENVDLFEGAEVELSAEYVNKALTLQWNAGLLTGLAMRDEEAKDLFTKIQPIMLLIIFLIVCIMAYMMYMMYGKIDSLDVNAIKTFIELAKSQASNVTVTVGP